MFRHLPPYVLEELLKEASAHNRSQLIFAWTRREHTILRRLASAKVRCPQPYGYYRNVLVMELIGTDGMPSPPLQEMVVTDPDAVYSDMVEQVRRMLTGARLVHGDLSPYNVLLHEGRPVLIDVAQSIDVAHPQAKALLERDIRNFAKYFAKLGVETSESAMLDAVGTNEISAGPGVVMPVLYIRIPGDRVGAAIGPGGSVKRTLAATTHTEIEAGPEDGQFRVTGPDDGDPLAVMKARDFLLAVGRGFSPERARRLLRDDTYLAVIDIKVISGKRGKSQLWRIRSRLIGSEGKARERLEELSGCSISVYGSTVAVIGRERELERATQAIELLLHGSEHSTVFHMLARQRQDDARDAASAPAEVEDLPE